VPDTKVVLRVVEKRRKDVSNLCHHSVKLAVAFRLINTTPGTPLCIIKDLQVCGESANSSTNFIAKIAGRAIMVRDPNHFHHFQDGVYSCMDFC
jgi:hypothetical protein